VNSNVAAYDKKGFGNFPIAEQSSIASFLFSEKKVLADAETE